MQTVKILIVEDEVIIADYIHELLVNEGYQNVKIANDVNEAKDLYLNFQPEIILLDININGENEGIKLSQNLELKSKVIYLTAQHDKETIKAAIKTLPQAYLTKPINKNDLSAALQLAITKLFTNSVQIKDGHDEIKLHFDEILFVKSDGNYIDVFCTDRKYTLRRSLENFKEDLDPETFVQIHRSIVVNLNKVSEKRKKTILINDIELPISRSHKSNL